MALGVHGAGPQISLEDRYTQLQGEVFLSGVQALVRMLLDQQRADAEAGRRTAILTSGYQGSPLGGFDREITGLRGLAVEHNLVHRPGVNEELGATAVWGSQLAGTLPDPIYDGVIGVWYGKAPGVDRAADALRHGNYVGADPRGGMIALCGDDPDSKSSTLPSASEPILAALGMPVLAPGSVQEVLDLGRHAIACSRASGLWTALKVNTVVADATATATVGISRVTPVMPTVDWLGEPYIHRPSGHLLPPDSLQMEQTLNGPRRELARAYARANGLNEITSESRPTRIGVVATGIGYHQLLEALAELGALGRVRLLRLGMVFPLDEAIVREFASGLDEVVVVEEKGPFLELLIRDALYGTPDTPRVLGKRDADGADLLPATGASSSERIARAVGVRLLASDDLPEARAHLERLQAISSRTPVAVGQARTPHFCAGCPHSVSTRADDDVLVGAGIGCHTMVMINGAGRGQVAAVTQMGGEGAQWIGAAPFIAPRHFVQNLGDGTFHHSGSMAIRAAIAANLNVTYKLLYNDVVAMTGGQTPVGQMTVAEIARELEAEGVRRIIVTTEDTNRYAGVALPGIAEVLDRSRMGSAQRELAAIDGVTVLIHDQACATELRRARKRGLAPEPTYRIAINERVCEGCGDCGAKSSCLSLEPVETEFGRKTRIDPVSCNVDASCLEGDCPSFVRISPPRRAPKDKVVRKSKPRLPEVALPGPALCVPVDDVRVRLVGIGGTGVVTLSQVLGMAALLDGHRAAGLDQTGLSQKAGPVVSDIRLTTITTPAGAMISQGTTDVLIGLDILGAVTPGNLAMADEERTVAIVSTSLTPTVDMVTDVNARSADLAGAVEAINAVTRARENVFVDARLIAERLVGSAVVANVVVLGAAWQRGAIPLSHGAVREAFAINGVAVDANHAAFEWGRAAVAAPETVAAALDGAAGPLGPGRRGEDLLARLAPGHEELRRRLGVRVDDLVGWGGRRAAERYMAEVERTLALEADVAPGSTAVTEAFAVGLHKLTAYKDEYEVARLHLENLATIERGAKVMFLLHPPALRALGLERKIALGRWFVPVFRVLKHARRLRGTPLDVFGYAHLRRVERRLAVEYTALVRSGLEVAGPATIGVVRQLAELADVVRGYEELKLANVERFRQEARALLSAIAA